MSSRTICAKRLRQSSDDLKTSIVSLIDSLASPTTSVLPLFEVRSAYSALSQSLNDWDNIKHESEAKQWRGDTRDRLRATARGIGEALEDNFPDLATTRSLNRKLPQRGTHHFENQKKIHVSRSCSKDEKEKDSAAERGGEMDSGEIEKNSGEIEKNSGEIEKNSAACRGGGPEVDDALAKCSLLAQSHGRPKDGPPAFKFTKSNNKLELVWVKFLKVELGFNSTSGGVCKIRVRSVAEEQWPSKFDVFRDIEREAYRSLYEARTCAELETEDAVTAKLISALAQHDGLFQRKEASGKFVAFGTLSKTGEFQARPPTFMDEFDNFVFAKDFA